MAFPLATWECLTPSGFVRPCTNSNLWALFFFANSFLIRKPWDCHGSSVQAISYRVERCRNLDLANESTNIARGCERWCQWWGDCVQHFVTDLTLMFWPLFVCCLLVYSCQLPTVLASFFRVFFCVMSICVSKLHTTCSLLFFGTTLHAPNESAEDEKHSQTGQIVLGTSHGHRTLILSLTQLDPSQRRVQKKRQETSQDSLEDDGSRVDECGHNRHLQENIFAFQWAVFKFYVFFGWLLV